MNYPFIRYKNVGRTFVRFVTIHACDARTYGQADGIAIGKTALHKNLPPSTVRTAFWLISESGEHLHKKLYCHEIRNVGYLNGVLL